MTIKSGGKRGPKMLSYTKQPWFHRRQLPVLYLHCRKIAFFSLTCTLLKDHSNSSVFPLMPSQKSSSEAQLIPKKGWLLNKWALCTHTLRNNGEEETRGGIGVHSLHFPPSRRMAAESRNKHHRYLQRALAATRKPVSSVWHCLVEYKRLSVWKVQERKRRVCGLVLQSKAETEAEKFSSRGWSEALWSWWENSHGLQHTLKHIWSAQKGAKRQKRRTKHLLEERVLNNVGVT